MADFFMGTLSWLYDNGIALILMLVILAGVFVLCCLVVLAGKKMEMWAQKWHEAARARKLAESETKTHEKTKARAQAVLRKGKECAAHVVRCWIAVPRWRWTPAVIAFIVLVWVLWLFRWEYAGDPVNWRRPLIRVNRYTGEVQVFECPTATKGYWRGVGWE
jgi:type VI protein secretion system component VasF